MQITVNQHYVPRFYMKPFANIVNEGSKKEKVFISFFQFKGNLFKEDVPTSSVCSEDYFYDKDGKIENSLADMETKWSKAIGKAINGEKLMQEEIESIKEFVVYQISRTKAMLFHNREMVSNIMKGTLNQQFGEVENDTIQDLLQEKIQNEITPEFGLKIVNDTIPTITDLKMKIISNDTKVDFFTSDVPVIVTNPLGVYSAGLGSIGEVIFFPISPRKMAILYDEKMYGGLVDIINDIDIIDAFNKYQYISADERLLAKNIEVVNRAIGDTDVIAKRERFHTSQKTSTVNDGVGTFIAAKSRSIPYWNNIPVLKLPKQLRRIPVDFRETFPREYSYDTRRALLCRVYRDPDFITKKELKDYWRKQQGYSKILLNYLDGYWNTPKEDRNITPELMYKLKTVPVSTFMNN